MKKNGFQRFSINNFVFRPRSGGQYFFHAFPHAPINVIVTNPRAQMAPPPSRNEKFLAIWHWMGHGGWRFMWNIMNFWATFHVHVFHIKWHWMGYGGKNISKIEMCVKSWNDHVDLLWFRWKMSIPRCKIIIFAIDSFQISDHF